MASTIFNLGAVKLLKKILRFQESDIQIITGNSADPTVTAVDAVAGSIYIRGGTNEVYVKNTSGSNTDFSKLGTVDSLNAHINDTTDAHDASAISNVAAGNLASTDVQSALNELQSDVDTRALASDLSNHLSDAVDAHDASAISNIPSGNLAATDLQSAVNELQSDVDTRALDSAVIKKDGSVAFTAAQSMGGFKVTSLAAGTAASDAVNKGQMDAALEGLKPKAAVRVATTADVVIATALNSGDVIDGITLANGDRVLLKDQAAAEANGIYVVSATPARSTDFDSLSPIDEVNGSLVAVQEGTANAGKVFVQAGVVAVLDTDPINFVFFNSSSSLVGGDGITVSGSNISVDHDGQGLQFTTNQLALELDGTTLSKSATGLKVGTITSSEMGALSVTNSAVATGIDAVKIADGSVSNTEFQYLDGVTSAIQTQLNAKASTGLNNLSVTTNVNQNLSPNADVTRDLGTTIRRWKDAHISKVLSTSVATAAGVNVLSTTDRELLDSTGADVVRWETKELVDASAVPSINWQSREANDYAGLTSFNYDVRTLNDGLGNAVVSFANPDLFLFSNKITSVADPTAAQDAATKNYVDTTAEPLHNTTLVQATNATLGANVTNEVVTGLTFAFASFNGCTIDYRIQKGTLVRVGKMLVATDGTNVSLNDSFVETVDSTIVFEAVVNGANINIRHTNTETGTITMTYQQNKFAV